MTQSLTSILAEFVTKTEYEHLPEAVIEKAKDCLLDWLGCALAGSREQAIAIFKDTFLSLGEGNQATLIGFGGMTNVLNATVINGASGNLLDLDDVFPGMIGHPSSSLWPALLSVAEWKGLSGKELLTAFVIGYEVEARLGLGVQPEHYELGWHATGTLGHFGSAAGVGKLLKLTTEQMINAFALAGTQASGLRELFGTPSKSIHHGRAGADAIAAVLLAKQGLQSTDNIFEGKYGFPRAFGTEIKRELVLEGLGSDFCMMKTAFKRHAACGSIHSTIDGILDLMQEHRIPLEDITEVNLIVHSLAADLSDNPNPQTGLEGKYSLQYSAAVTLVEGKASLDQYSDDRLQQPLIADLMKKVTVEVDKSYQYIEAMPAKITIKTRGNEYSCFNDTPKGRPSNPFSLEDKRGKFNDLGKGSLSQDKLDKAFELIQAMETNENVSGLLSVCY